MVLPTYNEGDNILPLMARLETALADHSYELVVVDDDSPDGTWQKAQNYRPGDPRIRVIRRINERGLTSAIYRGIVESRGENVGWMDCDLSHPPELVNTLLQHVLNGQTDAAIASRFVHGGADTRSGTYATQRVLSSILSQLSQFITRLPVKDITSGYIVMKKSIFDQFELTGDYGEYFIYLVHHMHSQGHRMMEIPIEFGNRQFGESKTGGNLFSYFKRGIKYLKMLYDCRVGKSISRK